MKRILCVIFLVCLSGCDLQLQIDCPGITPSRPEIKYPEFKREFPTVNLEQAFRQSNWVGSEGEGSCVHASMISLFHFQGRHDLAEKWVRTYENGEWPEGLAAKFDKQGVRYAYTSGRNDVPFLEWACQTRRGCGVTVKGGKHMICLVHLDDKWAGLLDCNKVNEIRWVSRKTFLNEWFNSNSWAVTPVYSPPPPRPCT